MPVDSTQGLNAVPAHLLGTRQAIFHLIRDPAAPEALMPAPRHDRLADRMGDAPPVPRPQTPPFGLPPERTTVLLRDLLSEDRFVF
jgi:hypothetical protein